MATDAIAHFEEAGFRRTRRTCWSAVASRRGWKNNVAGAHASPIDSLRMAWSGNEPSMAQEVAHSIALFATLGPSLAGVPEQNQSAMYIALIACATLPPLLHFDGKDNSNRAELEQPRELAAH